MIGVQWPWRLRRAADEHEEAARWSVRWTGADFVALLEEQVRQLERGMKEWTSFLVDKDPSRLETIDAIEEDGDRARLAVVRASDDHFITPIDREDLYTLSRAIDAVLDAVETAMVEAAQHAMDYSAVNGVVAILSAAVIHIRAAVAALLTRPDVVREEAVQIHRAAKRIDWAAREGLHALGSDGLKDLDEVRAMIFAREINHYLRAIGERLDNLSDILAEIEVKSR